MTTAAMVLGVVPLITATGAGAVSRFQMGVVIASGLSIGTLFTLFVVPAVYMLLAADHHVRCRRCGAADAAAAGPDEACCAPESAAKRTRRLGPLAEARNQITFFAWQRVRWNICTNPVAVWCCVILNNREARLALRVAALQP